MGTFTVRHDLTLEAAALAQDGSLATGIYATYDGTQLNGSPLPIHTKAHKGYLVVTYQCQYVDRRVRIGVEEGVATPYVLVCPKCGNGRELLRLTDEGEFLCETCVPFAPHPATVQRRKRRQLKWEKMQERTLELRKELRNYTDAPRDIKWLGPRMPKRRFRALIDELKTLEPKMIAAYLAYTKKHLDTITGIQGPLPETPETKNPPMAGQGSNDEG